MTDKETKELLNLLTKIVAIYNDFYVFSIGYVISLDITEPYILEIDDKYIRYLKESVGDFKVIHIINGKEYKKEFDMAFQKKILLEENEEKFLCTYCDFDKTKYSDDLISQFTLYLHELNKKYYDIPESKSVINRLTDELDKKLKEFQSLEDWDYFILSENEEENKEIIQKMFEKNDYIVFEPKCKDTPEIIVTKSLFPSLTIKNTDRVLYTTKKKNDSLYMLGIDYTLELFRVFMVHYYISIEKKDEVHE